MGIQADPPAASGVIEVRLTLDLGHHAPPDSVGLARALASELRAFAVDIAVTAAKAGASEEVHAARRAGQRRGVRHQPHPRAGAGPWQRPEHGQSHNSDARCCDITQVE